jgi:phosphoribosylaminoimidazole-succinocarboxamide synthase
MEKRKKLYEGKAKSVWSTDDPGVSVMYFKDDATAFNAAKKGSIRDKGVVNNKVSARIFEYLEAEGVKTHFIERLGEREMAVKSLEIIPVEVIVRNVAAGSLTKRLGVEEGTELKTPILEFCYKSDELGDPFINDYIIEAFGYATRQEVKFMEETTLRVNELLTDFFDKRGIILVDFKLEYGRHGGEGGEVLLGDEVTPDGCRLWDKATHEKLDKDRFRRDLGKIEEAYEEVLRKVME